MCLTLNGAENNPSKTAVPESSGTAETESGGSGNR